MSSFHVRVVRAYNDPARVEVIVEGFALSQKLWTKQDVIHAQLLSDMGSVADRNR